MPSKASPASSVTATKVAPVAAKKPAVKAVPVAAVAPSIPPQVEKKSLDTVVLVTEAQLRKMSEDEYMNDVQLAFFRKKLEEMRAQILANANNTGEHLRENEVTTDPADRATQEEEYTLELRTRDRERKLLKKIEKSLLTVDDGSYGWCEETGEPIGIPRLLARPTASLSLEAQERRERLQKLYG